MQICQIISFHSRLRVEVCKPMERKDINKKKFVYIISAVFEGCSLEKSAFRQ